MTTYLWNLQCATSNDNAEPEPFGQSILQTFHFSYVKIVDEDFVAVFPDESLCGAAEKPWNMVGESGHLSVSYTAKQQQRSSPKHSLLTAKPTCLW